MEWERIEGSLSRCADSYGEALTTMRARRRHRRQRNCPHRVTVAVRSGGIERQVCESCGHVGVRFLADLSGDVERTRFARPIERGEGAHLPELGSLEEESDGE